MILAFTIKILCLLVAFVLFYIKVWIIFSLIIFMLLILNFIKLSLVWLFFLGGGLFCMFECCIWNTCIIKIWVICVYKAWSRAPLEQLRKDELSDKRNKDVVLLQSLVRHTGSKYVTPEVNVSVIVGHRVGNGQHKCCRITIWLFHIDKHYTQNVWNSEYTPIKQIQYTCTR